MLPSISAFIMRSQEGKETLLDPKSMDGPTIPWTVADLLASNKRIFMTYHVMATPWDVLSPFGAVFGGISYRLGAFKRFPSMLASMGTTGFYVGALGMCLGLAKMYHISSQGDAANPPWTDDGIQMRVDGLRHNFKVRVLDISAWGGIGIAAGALVFTGGPTALGLSAGTKGLIQALTLGSVFGSLGAFGCIYWTRPKSKKDDDDDE